MLRHSADDPPPNRILVFRIGNLGDTVVALPAFWALRRAYPNALITLLTNYDVRNPDYPSAIRVLPPAGLFDEYISYPNGETGSRSLISRLGLLVTIRKHRFDSVYYLMTRNRLEKQIRRDIKFFRMAGIKLIKCVEHLRANTLGVSVPCPTPDISLESQFLVDCLRAEGVVVNHEQAFDLLLTDDERNAAAQFFEEKGVKTTGRILVAIAPSSKWQSKVWPEDRFAAVGQKLISNLGIIPVIVGGREDQAIGERLTSAWNCGINAAGKLTIRQSAALMEHCSLYLGNDTGAMHLAGAVGTPCVAVFAALDWPGRWHPGGSEYRILRSQISCQGCQSRTCSNEMHCMSSIDPDSVYDACLELLAGNVVIAK